MLESIKLNCDGYRIDKIKYNNEELIQFSAGMNNEYLVKDFQIKGEYLRQVIRSLNDQTYFLRLPKGRSLEKFVEENYLISEKIIKNILIQILEALVTLYKNKILGRCFSIENVFWDGSNITMMHFGFYPEIWQVQKNYDHRLDTLLLGQIAYSLITCQKIVKENYQEVLICSPVSEALKEITRKMLDLESQRIELQNVAKFFKQQLSEETYQFYLIDYPKICEQIDQIINKREKETSYLIDIIPNQISQEEKDQQNFINNLIFFNKNKNEDQCIWEILHNEIYRIYLLTNLKQIIQDKYSQQEGLVYIDQLQFIVDKTICIVKSYFQQFLLNKFKNDHKSFIEKSTSYNTLKKVLKDNLMMEKQFLTIETIKNQKKKKQTDEHFNLEFFESDFNDIKLTFRKYVIDVYRYFEKNAEISKNPKKKLELVQNQLRVLLALILNQVIINKELHFKTVKRVVGSDIFKPIDLEVKFFKVASIEQIQEQIQEIHDLYFSS
ncbi:unnamed protein product [Paramecium sonneborni]|uniref:Protein kinase domain-containing protein n=1 Tax=Paramecium sonneborni TaxID=65129 RepID=A0A8S1M3T2_9CILI|nr:unnamed protein product [Paramecium sonneborni]